jgi:putative SOS response-associated peptidase YedK
MCGRYYRRSTKQRIAEALQAGLTIPFEILPSFNIAPGTFQPVVKLDDDSGDRKIVPMRWGLVPFWSKDSKPNYSTVNARAETITINSSYREAIKSRRCLVPADGFYEWKKLDAKNKQPFAISLIDRGPFAFAGLWERWRDRSTNETLDTYTIITTDPNDLISSLEIHNRMPVILSQKNYSRWLEPGDPQRPPIDLLRPFEADEMTAWPVGKDVGNVKNDRPDLIEATLDKPSVTTSGNLFD